MFDFTLSEKTAIKSSYLALLAAILIIYPLNQAKASSDSCQLTPQENRTLISFDKRLFGNRTQDQAMSSGVKINLKPGYYRVTLQSYDRRPSNSGISQPSEHWHAIFSNNQGQTITTSSSIKDIPDNTDTVVETTDDNLLISNPVSEITAYHSAYPTRGPNSVTPVCAAFDFINDAPASAISPEAAISTTPTKTTPVTAQTGPQALSLISLAFAATSLVVTSSLHRWQNH
jgi:hypothetical protein